MSIICAMLVVTIHIDWCKDIGCLTWYIREVIANGFARIAVPYFFAVSGYFLAVHFDEKGWWQQGIKKRCRTILAPYLIWSGIAYILFAILSMSADLMANRSIRLDAFISTRSFASTLGLDLSDTPQLIPIWYLRCLFILVVFSPFLKIVIDKIRIWWMIIVFTIGILMLYCLDVYNLPYWGGFLCYGVTVDSILYFSVGMYICRFKISNGSHFWAVMCAVYGIGYLGIRTMSHLLGCTLPSILGRFMIPSLLYVIWHVMPYRVIPMWLTSSSFSIFIVHVVSKTECKF